MGSPLSPVIADIVMRDLETSCLNNVNCHITFYYRYVDDIVMAVSSDNIDLIFKTFNEYHDRIKFTIEYEESRSLSFLDLLLTIKDDTLFIGSIRGPFREDFCSLIPAIHYAIRWA